MREFDALRGYPEPTTPRIVGTRTIKNRITASYRGRSFYDGDRDDGYGGFVDDGRWKPIAQFMAEEYKLKRGSSVLQVGCDKGFLLSEFKSLGMQVAGVENSGYAVSCAIPEIRANIRGARYTELPFEKRFDLVIAIGAVYTLNLRGAINCLAEIVRLGRKAFITLGAYESDEDYWLIRDWSLLGCTILRKDEWIEVLQHVAYTGDYKFNTAKSLRLQRAA